MDSINPVADESPYKLMLMAAISIPVSHYLIALLSILIVIVYKILEMHFVQDLLTGFRGQPVRLTFNPSSELYRHVVSKCTILHGRWAKLPCFCKKIRFLICVLLGFYCWWILLGTYPHPGCVVLTFRPCSWLTLGMHQMLSIEGEFFYFSYWDGQYSSLYESQSDYSNMYN